MTPVTLFAVAFLVRLAVGALFAGPAYPDSYYYVNVAQQLAAGNGFQVDYLWSFVDVGGRLPSEPDLPVPSNGHWMPLASLVQVPVIWALGATPLAFGLPFWLAGAAAAPLTWAIGRDAGLPSMAALTGGLLVAVPAGMTPFLSQPDNFGLFMPLGAMALWLCARGLRGDRRAFVVGGLVVGLATLARTDGVLLGVPFALAAAVDLRRRGIPRRIGLAAAAACALLFALVVAPWVVRQLDVFGTLSPSAASGRILWISDISQLHSISGPTPTPATLLEGGLGALLASRVDGLLAALGLFAFLPLAVVLAPFALLGAWVLRHDPDFAPFLIYAICLFGASALLFAVHVRSGTFIHSAVALLPHTFLLVMTGIASAVGWIARRRATWDAQRAPAFFMAGALLVAVLAAALQTSITTQSWAAQRAVQTRLAEGLASAGGGERLAASDAGAFRYLSGHPGIVTPSDPLPVIEQALRAYDVRWLALESRSIVPALVPVLVGDERPAWLSGPLLTVAGSGAGDPPAGALYAVCLGEDLSRCSP
ncbi:MAG TPA: glycosyltransferase family 39 protein [Candidatus Limnocylindria bacterium]|nr:glycosyltransferase family 39 protein [Candidatus Limnocylindria bacterium]